MLDPIFRKYQMNHNSKRNKFFVSKGILITKGILVAYLVSLKNLSSSLSDLRGCRRAGEDIWQFDIFSPSGLSRVLIFGLGLKIV